MSAGDFLRRAAGGMQSTLAQASSTVTQVAQGRKRYDVANEATEKCTMTIKCTPNKDAITTTALSIKSGYLMKRNEQGQWQRRYICTVPHLFLYYFDSDTSDAPRGVIDLELYNNISRNKNFLKVAPTNEERLRSFHFQSDDSEGLNDWMTHFMRDRYFAVCDERNAYQQMQSEMTAVLDTISCQTRAVEIDKDIVEQQLRDALLAKQQAMAVLQNMLVIVGITEEESAQLQDINRLAHCLETHVANMKRELEIKFFGPDEVLEAEKAARKADVLALQEAIELETRARKNVEAMMLKIKKANELREQQLQCEIDTLQLNFQLLVTAKAEADKQNATLQDQKKLLIKEIKRLRTQLTETESSLERVEGINGKFTDSVSSLQTHLRRAEATIAELQKAAIVAEKQYQQREQAAVTAAVVAAMDAVSMGGNLRRTTPAEIVVHNDAATVTMAASSDDTSGTLPTICVSEGSGASANSGDDGVAPAVEGQDATLQAELTESKEDPRGTPVHLLSADAVNSILLESQSIMASLRPLPGAGGGKTSRAGSIKSGGGLDTPTGTLSASNSGSNLAAGGLRDRHNSTDSGCSPAGPASPQDLRELGWLSPEQERLVDNRLKLHTQTKPEVEAHYKYLDSSNTTRSSATDGAESSSYREEERRTPTPENSSGMGGGSGGEGFSTSAAASAASAAATRSLSMLSGAMTLLSATASSMHTSAAGSSGTTADTDGNTPGGKRTAKGIISSMFQSGEDTSSGDAPDPDREDPERLPSAMRLNCLRCAGTVEGPKYSTCRCSVPALTPEDLPPSSAATASSTSTSGGDSTAPAGGNKSSWGFGGMLARGSTALKEGLAKASQVTASNVESLVQITKAAASSGSTGDSSAKEGNTGGSVEHPARKEGYLFYNTVVSSPVTKTETLPGEVVLPEKELWGYFAGTQPALRRESEAAVTPETIPDGDAIATSTEPVTCEEGAAAQESERQVQVTSTPPMEKLATGTDSALVAPE